MAPNRGWCNIQTAYTGDDRYWWTVYNTDTKMHTNTHRCTNTIHVHTHTHYTLTASTNPAREPADLTITLAYCTASSYVASRSRLAVLGSHSYCRQHTCPCGIPSSAWLSPCSCGCYIHWSSGTPCIVTWRPCTHLVAHEDTDTGLATS